MTKITLGGTPISTIGDIPKNGTKAPSSNAILNFKFIIISKCLKM